MVRAEEEIKLLREEREFCLLSYTVKERVLCAASDVAERAATDLEAGAPNDAAYNAGLALLWRREAAAVRAQAERARKLFGEVDWGRPGAADPAGSPGGGEGGAAGSAGGPGGGGGAAGSDDDDDDDDDDEYTDDEYTDAESDGDYMVGDFMEED